jgi:hypothetical protein
MAEPMLHRLPASDLESALRGLAPTIEWPTAGRADQPDLATVVRVRLESMPVPATTRWPWPRSWPSGGWSARPARRALVLALVALLAVAAIAGAVGLGLPGLRLILGGAPPSALPSLTPASPGAATPATGSPTPRVLGGSLGLGEPLDPDDAAAIDERAGFHVLRPTAPGIGAPESAWIDDRKGGQVTLLWPPGETLPATDEPGVGLLVSQFRGGMDEGFYTKIINNGTVVAPVRVAGGQGYWLSGDEHYLFWEGPEGFVDDARRWVGDVLLWTDGSITYRLETSLGREEAIRIAESMD